MIENLLKALQSKFKNFFQIKNQTGTVLSILTYFVHKLWL